MAIKNKIKYKNYHYYSQQHGQDYNGYYNANNIMAIRLPEIKQNKI